MSPSTIRPAYGTWPEYNRRLRAVVAAMTVEQLAIRPETLGAAGLPQVDLWGPA